MDDLISRQAAIDALDRFSLGETDAIKLAFRMGDYLKRLPSAQPERKTGRWIPCSERLPEENGEYLVTRESKGIYKFVDIVKKTNTSGDIASDIVAWMPLPEPYKGEQDG